MKTAETTTQARRLIAAIRANLAMPQMIMQLQRLLADGEPVTVEHVAATGGWRPEEVRAELKRHPGTDWHPDGRIAGFGLTLRPTPHAFTFDHKTVYGYCASDVLAFPIILGRPGVATSTCPVTGHHIHAELTPTQVLRLDPTDAVVTKVRPTEAVADVRAEICDLGNFFSSPAAASDWLAHHPQGKIDPVADDFAITRQAFTELGWAATSH